MPYRDPAWRDAISALLGQLSVHELRQLMDGADTDDPR